MRLVWLEESLAGIEELVDHVDQAGGGQAGGAAEVLGLLAFDPDDLDYGYIDGIEAAVREYPWKA